MLPSTYPEMERFVDTIAHASFWKGCTQVVVGFIVPIFLYRIILSVLVGGGIVLLGYLGQTSGYEFYRRRRAYAHVAAIFGALPISQLLGICCYLLVVSESALDFFHRYLSPEVFFPVALVDAVFLAWGVEVLRRYAHEVSRTPTLPEVQRQRGRMPYVLSAALLFLLGVIALAFWGMEAEIPAVTRPPIDKVSVMLAVLFTRVIIAPSLEEILFRAFLFTIVAKRGGALLGLIVSSGIFALYHGQWVMGNILFLVMIGAALSLIYLRFGLCWAILVHVGYATLWWFAKGP